MFGFLLLDVKTYLDTARDSGGVERKVSEFGHVSSYAGLKFGDLGLRVLGFRV